MAAVIEARKAALSVEGTAQECTRLISLTAGELHSIHYVSRLYR